MRLTAPKYSEEKLSAAAFALAEAIENHASLEDELLFAALVASDRMPAGPVEAMRQHTGRSSRCWGRSSLRQGRRAARIHNARCCA